MSLAWITLIIGLATGIIGFATGFWLGIGWALRGQSRSPSYPAKRIASAAAAEKTSNTQRSHYPPPVSTIKPVSSDKPRLQSKDRTTLKYKDFSLDAPWPIVVLVTFVILAVATLLYVWKQPEHEKVSNAGQQSQVNIVITQMQAGAPVEMPLYNIRLAPAQHPVIGVPGETYLIELKGGDKDTLFLFEAGKYTQHWTTDFFKAMRAVQQDVMVPLRKQDVPYRVFLRGSADIAGNNLPVIDDLLDGDLLNKSEVTIQYLPSGPHDEWHFSQDPQTMIVPRQYQNKHLPNLRAWFIQQKLKDIAISSDILNGTVTPQTSERDRNVYLLLCIHWKSTQ